MIIVIDNGDSFVYNIIHLLHSLQAKPKLIGAAQLQAEQVLALRPDGIVLSSGFGAVEKGGGLENLIHAALKSRLPLLGLGVGHLALGQYFGAQIVPAKRIMHGKLAQIEHQGERLFCGLKKQFKALCYYSLALQKDSLPAELQISASAEDGELMAIEHKQAPLFGLQYNLESLLSSSGKQQMANFVKISANKEY